MTYNQFSIQLTYNYFYLFNDFLISSQTILYIQRRVLVVSKKSTTFVSPSHKCLIFSSEPAGPVKPTRRKYDRDFLLQLQFIQVCTQKPAGLPNIEVVLDSPTSQNRSGGSQR